MVRTVARCNAATGFVVVVPGGVTHVPRGEQEFISHQRLRHHSRLAVFSARNLAARNLLLTAARRKRVGRRAVPGSEGVWGERDADAAQKGAAGEMSVE